MPDLAGLSGFTPRLQPFAIIPWWDAFAIRTTGGTYHFITAHEKDLIDLIRSENPTVGRLNETLYRRTNRISPLEIVEFLLDLSRRGLLANADKLEALLPDIPRPALPRSRFLPLFPVTGLGLKAGLVLPLLGAAALAILVMQTGMVIPACSLYPAGHLVPALLAIPLTILGLAAARGLWSLLLFLAMGHKAVFGLGYSTGLPLPDMEPRAMLGTPPVLRFAYYLARLIFYPTVMLAAAVYGGRLPAAWQPYAGLAFFLGLPLILFDLYLLRDTVLVRLIEEFAGEPGLKTRFTTFWNRGFATLQSLVQPHFPKEALYFGMGAFQIAWFAAYLFLIFFGIRHFIPALITPALEQGPLVLVPGLVLFGLALLFFAFTFVPFILRKTAGITVSLLDLGSALIMPTGRKAGVSDERTVDLKQIHIFAAIPEKELAEIEPHVAVSERNPYKILIKEGELGTMLLAIRKGRAVVFKQGSRGEEVELALLKEGDVFGERALLGEGKRTASVRSLTHMQLYVIPKEIFFTNLSERIGTPSRISEIIMAANAVQGLEIFENLPPQATLRLAARVRMQLFPPGTEILSKDAPSNDTFYAVKRGEVRVHEAGPDGEDVILKANSYFGELALLNNAPRTATVTADTETEVFTFAKDDFLEVLFMDLGSVLRLETEGRRRMAELLGRKA